MTNRHCRQPTLDLGLGAYSSMDSEDFLIAECNRDAITQLQRTKSWPHNILLIVGPPASGKTHLAQIWKHKNRAIELSMQELNSQLDKISSPKPSLLLENIELISHFPQKKRSEVEQMLFHLYNRAWASECYLLLSSRKLPGAMSFVLPDLASRLRGCHLALLEEPDERTLAAIMIKLLADRQLQVSHSVAEYAVRRMERSFANLRELVAMADAESLACGSAVTIPLVRDLLLRQARTKTADTEEQTKLTRELTSGSGFSQ